MSAQPRSVERIVEPEPVVEGAGVRLKRSIGTGTLDTLDPFLLLDHFASSNPEDYEAGFPLHPHRGIETVTYVLVGEVRHKDTLGNSGSIGAGDLQWMTAGGGIMHEEMPQLRPEGIAGFQLWVNLPARLKMTTPRYQEIRSRDIPEIHRPDGSTVRLIAGAMNGARGPISGIAANPVYADVGLPPGTSFACNVSRGQTAFAYLFEGQAAFAPGQAGAADVRSPALVVWSDGDRVQVSTAEHPARFLLISGRPLHEPVARYGPFVMNTRQEIEQAIRELREGTFIKGD
ncbi:MAG: pirin family protein [Acidobacteria bacterium]|nr:pirin family protein [Acidobacteriota bacterium]